jgi:hypothetical protein
MANTKTTTISISTFAANVARNEGTLKSAATPYATCYAKADTTGKSQLLGEWKDGYVRGTFSLGSDFAASKGKAMQALVEAKKLDWKLYVAAIDRANSQFGYYISGTAGNKGAGKGTDSDDIAIPKNIRELAAALAEACNAYEGARKLASTAVANAFAATKRA